MDWFKATKLNLFWYKLKYKFSKWKLINNYDYEIIPKKNLRMYFKLSPSERKKADKIFKEKGTISYEFIPSGIGWIVKVHVLKTNELINITDYSTW